MPLKLDQIDEPGLNLTPMIDIVLLLVIFFMVGTEFTRDETQYDIELPTVTDAQPLTSLPDEIVLSVARDGTVLRGPEPVTLEQLEQDLKSASERYADQAVVIRGDAAASYQAVMTVLNVCKRADINNVQLASRPQTGAGG